MTTKPISSPIEYWNDGKTRIISPEDENGRKIEIGYFFGVQFTGYSTHYPLPLLISLLHKILIYTYQLMMAYTYDYLLARN